MTATISDGTHSGGSLNCCRYLGKERRQKVCGTAIAEEGGNPESWNLD